MFLGVLWKNVFNQISPVFFWQILLDKMDSSCGHFWHRFKLFQLRFQSAPREGELPLYDRGIELPQT